MLLYVLTACDPSTGPEGSIDTNELFPAEVDRFQAYRHRTPEAYADPEQADVLDESDLMFARFDATGCGADAWRVELRTGAEWATASGMGALHFDDGSGLSICGWEDAGGSLTSYDPPILLWDSGAPLAEAEPLTSGSWTVTPRREDDLLTYFGTFPNAISFTLEGDGALDAWVLHFAKANGLVVLQNAEISADLVYSR